MKSPLHLLERMVRRKGPLTDELKLSPSGTFGLVPDRLAPEKTHRSICGYCSVGCQLSIHMQDDQAVNLTASPDYPVNQNMACPKGWEALTPLQAQDRGTRPSLKTETGERKEVDWETAMDVFCDRFQSIMQNHGRESVAWIGTGQITNEELGLLGALGKFGMGWIHGDGNTRQCMASAVTAYKESFGFDAPPYTYDDLEQSDTLVFVGANPCIAHPILWHRVMKSGKRPEIIVIDPRMTETAASATLHLPIRPKSDLYLLYAVARILIDHQWVDASYIEKHTEGFEAFSKFTEDYTLEQASETTGLQASTIMDLAIRIHQGKAVSFWWTMGVNQGYQGTRTAQAIINLALMTGNIGRPGTGANSITGQCNAMGSRLFSNTTSLFAGRDFLRAEERQDVAGILKIPESSIPDQNSLPYDEILQKVDEGSIKGLWIIATNPEHSWIHQSGWQRLRQSKLEFLVVQDMYGTTETALEADLYLPAAGWGEKAGTFINSERRFGVIEAMVSPPGEARSDFDIFKSIATRWGCGDMFEAWEHPEAAFQILKQLSKDRACDFSGIRDYQMLQEAGGIQWPWTSEDAQGAAAEQERRLFEDGKFYHPNQRARFIFEPVRQPPEPPENAYPFWLLTGRGTSAQWHTQTRTGKSPILNQMAPASVYVEIHPDDAKRLQIRMHDPVLIESKRGRMRATAKVMPTVQTGQVFCPMHYPEVNQLTHPSFDPYSHQPSYKACAVQIRKDL